MLPSFFCTPLFRWLIFSLLSCVSLSAESKYFEGDPGNNYWHLNAQQQPLSEILLEITNKTGIIIHFSNFSTTLITANCSGKLNQILRCLFHQNSVFVYRYDKKYPKRQISNEKPNEIWLSDLPAANKSNPSAENVSSVNLPKKSTKDPNQFFSLDKLDHAKQQAYAFNYLAPSEDLVNNPIEQQLKNALSDPSSEARAQAVFALVTRKSQLAPEALQLAIQDQDPSVRLMAVDLSNEDIGLLEQTVNDPDETVRAYTLTKIKNLNKTNQMTAEIPLSESRP